MATEPRTGHLERTAQEPRGDGLHATTLSRIEQVNERIRVLRLDLQRGPIKFLPGQWIDTFVPGHPKPGGFTITCPPSGADGTQLEKGPPYLELAVQNAPENAVAAWLWRGTADILGATLHVRVGGSFVFPPSPLAFSRVVFVAGGVGVNPLMSMLSHIAETDSVRRRLVAVDVLYGSRLSGDDSSLDGVLFFDRIEALFRSSDNGQSLKGRLRMFLTGTSPDARQLEAAQNASGAEFDVQTRRMSVDDVRASVGEHGASTVVYICGPPVMTDEFAEALTRSPGSAIDPARVLTEKWW